MNDSTAKAWKLIEALAEKCDVLEDNYDHAWRECRHCLAIWELESKSSRLLMQALIAERDTLRARWRQRYLEQRQAVSGKQP